MPDASLPLALLMMIYSCPVNESSPPRAEAVSLFSNCGAGDVGFASAGFRFRIMAERVPSRLEVALRNHPGAHGVPGDLRQTWRDVVKRWRADHGSDSPDLLAACPPCQGMSTARSDRGYEDDPDASSRDPRNLLVLPVARIATQLLPTFLVLENVTAFFRRLVRDPESGDIISAARLLVQLLRDEYDVYPFITDLADFGVAQTRKRAFLTFVRQSSLPALSLRRSHTAPYPVPATAPDYGGQAIPLAIALERFGLPSLDAGCLERSRVSNHPLHFVPVWSPRQYRMVAAIPSGSGASAWDNDLCDTCGHVDAGVSTVSCPNCGHPLLRPVIEDGEHVRLVRGFRRTSYRRLHPARPAATVTTASGRIGGSRTLHPFENRVLSPLECARLQTIPPSFDWGSVLEQRGAMELRAMIGEAVPPRFTKLHGEVLLDLLARDAGAGSSIKVTDPRCKAASRRLGAN